MFDSGNIAKMSASTSNVDTHRPHSDFQSVY